jgi:hypothetical protein
MGWYDMLKMGWDGIGGKLDELFGKYVDDG